MIPIRIVAIPGVTAHWYAGTVAMFQEVRGTIFCQMAMGQSIRVKNIDILIITHIDHYPIIWSLQYWLIIWVIMDHKYLFDHVWPKWIDLEPYYLLCKSMTSPIWICHDWGPVRWGCRLTQLLWVSHQWRLPHRCWWKPMLIFFWWIIPLSK